MGMMGRYFLFGFLLAGCATTSSGGSSSPPEEEDPCRDPTFLEGVIGPNFGKAQRDAQCHEHLRKEHEQKVRKEQERVLAQTQRLKEEDRARVALVEEEARRKEEDYARRLAVRKQEELRRRYLVLVTVEGCAEDWEEDYAWYKELAQYGASEERDRAIGVLEGCRAAYRKVLRKRFPSLLKQARENFALEIEDRFDEANPYKKGVLRASVKGATVTFKHRGSIEGRRRHSQEQVEDWCIRGGSALFSKIVLSNGDGMFSCTPVGASPDRERLKRFLDAEGVGEPLSKEPGTVPVPGSASSGGDPFLARE